MRPEDRPLVLVFAGLLLIGLGVYLGSTLELDNRTWLKDVGPTISGALGTAATLIAGVLAWQSIQYQLREMQAQAKEMSRQTSAMAVDTLTRMVVSLEQEIQEFDKDYRGVREIARRPSNDSLMPETRFKDVDKLKVARTSLHELRSNVTKHAARNPQSDELSILRRGLIDSSKRLATVLRGLIPMVEHIQRLDPTEVGEGTLLQDRRRRATVVADQLDVVAADARAYASALRVEIARIWRLIRALEARTIGAPGEVGPE